MALPRIGAITSILNVILIVFLVFLKVVTFMESMEKITIKKSITMESLDSGYCVGYNLFEASEKFRDSMNFEPVSLITHTSPHLIGTLKNNMRKWNGPISLAIFVDIQTRNVLDYLVNLYKCDKDFRRKVSVHIVFKKAAFQKSCPLLHLPNTKKSCRKFHFYKRSLEIQIIKPFAIYPEGLMRNVARKGASSNLHFILDGDLIMDYGLDLKIGTVANQIISGKSQSVLLVRTQDNVNGTVIQKISNDSDWSKNSGWEFEPIFHQNYPYGPEYLASMDDKRAMMYKLCRANYTFHVLPDVSNVQKKSEEDLSNFSPAANNYQLLYVKDKALNKFRLEMNEIYPETLEKCGEFGL